MKVKVYSLFQLKKSFSFDGKLEKNFEFFDFLGVFSTRLLAVGTAGNIVAEALEQEQQLLQNEKLPNEIFLIAKNQYDLAYLKLNELSDLCDIKNIYNVLIKKMNEDISKKLPNLSDYSDMDYALEVRYQIFAYSDVFRIIESEINEETRIGLVSENMEQSNGISKFDVLKSNNFIPNA